MFVPQRSTNNLRKDIDMKYNTPEIQIFEVAVDKGYGDSVLLPGFGTEYDELIY